MSTLLPVQTGNAPPIARMNDSESQSTAMQPVPATSPSRAPRADEVRVLSRGLAILKAFMPRNLPLGNSQLAESTGLPRPTVSRLTATLTRLGYLEQMPAQGGYRLGISALTLGFAALTHADVRRRARPHMQRLANDEDLLVVLAVRHDMAMVCYEVCRGPGMLTMRVSPGSRLVLPNSAMGRALLGSLDPKDASLLRAQIATRFAAEWPHIEPALDEARQQIHELDFCVTLSSLEPDVNSTATVLDFGQGASRFVLGCSAPAFRYSPQRCLDELGPRLLAVRHAIERELGATGRID